MLLTSPDKLLLANTPHKLTDPFRGSRPWKGLIFRSKNHNFIPGNEVESIYPKTLKLIPLAPFEGGNVS